MPDIAQNWLSVLVVLATLVLLGTIFGLVLFAYYAFAAIQSYKFALTRLPAGNAAIVKGDSPSSVSKAGGEMVRRGSCCSGFNQSAMFGCCTSGRDASAEATGHVSSDLTRTTRL